MTTMMVDSVCLLYWTTGCLESWLNFISGWVF